MINSILFIVGCALVAIAVAITISAVFTVVVWKLRSAKERDFLQEYYEEEFGDKS